MVQLVDVKRDEAGLFRYIVKHAGLSSKAKVRTCHLDESVTEKHRVAYTAWNNAGKDYNVVFSLPKVSSQVFLIVTDLDPREKCQLIARLDAESETNDAIGFGYTTEILSDDLLEAGWVAAVCIPMTTLFRGFPKKVTLSQEEFSFQLITLISASELSILRKDGLVSLLEYFSRRRRSLIHLHNQINDKHEMEAVLQQELTALGEAANGKQYRNVKPIDKSKSAHTIKGNGKSSSKSNQTNDDLSVSQASIHVKAQSSSLKQATNKERVLKSSIKNSASHATEKFIEEDTASFRTQQGQDLKPAPELDFLNGDNAHQNEQVLERIVNSVVDRVLSKMQLQERVETGESVSEKNRKAVYVDDSFLAEASNSQFEQVSPPNQMYQTQGDAHQVFSLAEEESAQLASNLGPALRKKHWQMSYKVQVLGETILGTGLLVGGLLVTALLLTTEFPIASVFPGIFTLAGVMTLVTACRDAKRLWF